MTVSKSSVRQSALSAEFFDRHVEDVAPELLGKVLVRSTRQGVVAGRIVEVEAYRATDDPACHAAKGMTPRNEVMFGEAGVAYVYAIHSRWCLNAVTDRDGVPSAVLIRAVEPVCGIEEIRLRRSKARELDYARGPGRLCEAFDIDKRLNGHTLTDTQRLWICNAEETPPFQVQVSPRIGVTSGHELPLRYFIDGSRYVSGPRRWHSAG